MATTCGALTVAAARMPTLASGAATAQQTNAAPPATRALVAVSATLTLSATSGASKAAAPLPRRLAQRLKHRLLVKLRAIPGELLRRRLQPLAVHIHSRRVALAE
jgi:hypothetical protein